MYTGVSCEQSFYLLGKENRCRKSIYLVQSAKWFDNLVMLLIGLNSVKLGADTYLRDYEDGSTVKQISDIIDYGFNCAFAIEAFLKCIALGLIMERGSYLRDGWN